MSQPNAFAEFVERYGPPAGEEGPVRFAVEVLGGVLVDAPSPDNPPNAIDPWQQEALRAYGREERRISIRACHGPGKTYIIAVMILHQMLTRFPQHTKATAPSVGQLEGALVKEVLTLLDHLPAPLRDLFEVTKNHIALKAKPQESWFDAATARAEKPEALQGIHCDAGWVLLIADEASGIDNAIFESAGGSMSGRRATTVLSSNPVRTTGFFFDSHNRAKGEWYTIHVGAKDSSRVSEDFVRYHAAQYGEKSNAYRVRVLGEFPLGDLDKIISFEHVQAAQERDIETPPGLAEVWGLDCARFGEDETVLLRRNKLAVLPLIESWQGRDTMYTAGRVKATWDATPPHERPEEILIDVIGIGAGVVDRLRELGLPARGVNVSETDSVNPRYRNLRTQLWFEVAEWLAMKDRKLPAKCPCERCERDPRMDHAQQLARELVAVGFGYTSSGKLMAEPKDDTKKELGHSPNIADALCLTFAGEISTLMRGSQNGTGWNVPWNQPVERGLSIV